MNNLPKEIITHIGHYTKLENISKTHTLSPDQKWTLVKEKLRATYKNEEDASSSLTRPTEDADIDNMYEYFMINRKLKFEENYDGNPDEDYIRKRPFQDPEYSFAELIKLIEIGLSYKPFILSAIIAYGNMNLLAQFYELAYKFKNTAWIEVIENILTELVIKLIELPENTEYRVANYFMFNWLQTYFVDEYVPKNRIQLKTNVKHVDSKDILTDPFTKEHRPDGMLWGSEGVTLESLITFFSIVSNNVDIFMAWINFYSTLSCEDVGEVYILNQNLFTLVNAYKYKQISTEMQEATLILLDMIDHKYQVNFFEGSGLNYGLVDDNAREFVYLTYFQNTKFMWEHIKMVSNDGYIDTLFKIGILKRIISTKPVRTAHSMFLDIYNSSNYYEFPDFLLDLTYEKSLESDINNLSYALDIAFQPIFKNIVEDYETLEDIYIYTAKVYIAILDKYKLQNSQIEQMFNILKNFGDDLFNSIIFRIKALLTYDKIDVDKIRNLISPYIGSVNPLYYDKVTSYGYHVSAIVRPRY